MNPFLFAITVLPLCAAVSGGADDTTTLSLDAFLSLALKHHPQTRIASAQETFERASLDGARSGLLPQVGLSAQASRSGSGGTAGSVPTDTQSGLRSATEQYSAGISATQLLYDFGRTGSQIRQARQTLAATRESARSARHTVLLNAKTSYFNVLLARKVYDVARESLRQSEEHLLEAQTQFEIGRQAKYAVTKAEVDVANARVALIKAQNGMEKAHIGMEQAAGVALQTPLRLSDSLEQTEDSISLVIALGVADSLRPDLRAAVARLESARQRINGARAEKLPQLGASAGYNYRSPDATVWSSGWNAGVTLTQPIFRGGALQAKVAQAAASFEEANATIELTRQTAHVELKQLALDKSDATERAAAAEKLIAQADEGLAMSQERYRAGAATFIEVTDAEVALYNAKIAHAQALYDYRVAHAKLIRAMGLDR